MITLRDVTYIGADETDNIVEHNPWVQEAMGRVEKFTDDMEWPKHV